MRQIVLVVVGILVLVFACGYVAKASDTEADAIYAIYTEWGEASAADDDTDFLKRLDALYPEASPACQQYISLLFTGITLTDVGQRLSPDNKLGSMVGISLLLQSVEQAEYACRIAQ